MYTRSSAYTCKQFWLKIIYNTKMNELFLGSNENDLEANQRASERLKGIEYAVLFMNK